MFQRTRRSGTLLFITGSAILGGAGLVGAQAPGDAARAPATANAAAVRSGDRVAVRPLTPETAPPHPLEAVLELADRAVQRADELHDYSATFIKRERIDGRLSNYDYMFLKVRHAPFSIYLYCLGPVKPKGQEAIYVEGQNEGKVLGHTTGIRDRIAGTMSLDPAGSRMMEGNLYPLTSIGIKNLASKLANLHRYELNFGECEVNTYPGAKVDGRECTCVQVVHPVERENFKFHLSRTYYDHATGLPIRFEGYLWPTTPGGKPVLLEEYTYQNVQFNQGISDLDFDTQNPAYGYR
ncbi:MAG: DUF1571 domain-containing protein [Pirellulales bacterium]|nr:DUF1571 domain-containing protein [Pirellulales bacterium]